MIKLDLNNKKLSSTRVLLQTLILFILMSKNKISTQQMTPTSNLTKKIIIQSPKIKQLPKNKQSPKNNTTININSPKNTKKSISQDKIKVSESNSISKQIKRLTTPHHKSRISNQSYWKADDFQIQLESKVTQLNQKSKKMQAYIDLFNLMFSKNSAVRCLQHNNILTLYCTNERKILCVNCTYGALKHRMHKVLPLRNCFHYVIQDNELLGDILRKDLQTLDESYAHNQQNVGLLQKQYKKQMDQLDQDYKKKLDSLTLKYQTDKHKIEQKYSKLIQKISKITQGIQAFKHNVWDCLSKIEIGKGTHLIADEIAIMKQVFCVYLSQFTHLQIHKISNKQLERLSLKFKS